jgi:hypothetical protein
MLLTPHIVRTHEITETISSRSTSARSRTSASAARRR